MPQSPHLEYTRLRPVTHAWPGTAFVPLVLHWLLLFGWGLALNNPAGGYRYCRLAMPGPLDWSLVPWVFTAAGVGLLIALGLFDRTRLRIHAAMAFLPVVLFVLTQGLARCLVWVVY